VHVQLKAVLHADPDSAWRVLLDPEAFRAVARPLLVMSSGGRELPDRWRDGDDYEVSAALLGVLPLGAQRIVVGLEETRGDGVRIFHDTGGASRGPLAAVTAWDHRMAVSAVSDPSRCLYRDRLSFSAGVLTPVVWLSLWAFWQWRLVRLRRLTSATARSAGARPPV
jgi:hypothetical protein